uniref:Uncharacterized protein n=1 Tax=Sinocyclocheilus rhinocerous TaxID=307959 RepID=A0A673KNY9_9TELE
MPIINILAVYQYKAHILHDDELYKKRNLTRVQREALSALINDPTLTIQRADKGGGIVVMNTNTYVEKIKGMLHDETFYKKLVFNPTESYKKQIDQVLQIGLDRKWINEQELKYLKNEYPRIPVLYTLPKIHKSLEDPPMRPIVSGNGSLTETLSKFLDSLIQPIVKKLPSYLKDTTDFLNKLNQIPCISMTDWLVCSRECGS